MRRAIVVAAVLAWAPTALAHVGPSVRENNRYLKLTLLGDRIRVLYTYYLGEVPGAQARARLDRNRDGLIDDAEAAALGDEVAATVASNLALTLDGRPVAPAWDRVDVGLGTPTVNAGAMSVDLVTWLCLEPAPGAHALTLRDEWVPPQPGETELRIDAAPGVAVERAAFGDSPVSQLAFRWVGGAGPLAREGLDVAFTVGPDAAAGGSDRCGAPETQREPRPPMWPWLAGILALAALAGAALVYRKTNG